MCLHLYLSTFIMYITKAPDVDPYQRVCQCQPPRDSDYTAKVDVDTAACRGQCWEGCCGDALVAAPRCTRCGSPRLIGSDGYRKLRPWALLRNITGFQNGRSQPLSAGQCLTAAQVVLPSRISGFLQGRRPRAEYFFNTKNDMYGTSP